MKYEVRCNLKGLQICACPLQEGKFYRFKTANHPHTNMAKVCGLIALNVRSTYVCRLIHA